MTKHIGTWALVRVEAVDGSGAPVEPPPFGGDNFIGRDLSFEDDLMVLRPPMQSYGEAPAEQRTLWWRKISDV